MSRPSAQSPGEPAVPRAVDPEVPAAALASYLRALLRHRFLFAAVTLACVVGAALWLAQRSSDYRAHASILVSPIPATDETLVGLPLVRSSDLEPARATETAASLIDAPASARAAARILGSTDTAAVTSAVSVKAKPDTRIVQVTASGGSPARAAAAANAYARGALRARKERLVPEAERAISQTERELATTPSAATADALRARLASLRLVAQRGDPTLSLAAAANPGARAGPSAAIVLLLALAAGLVLACLTITLVELLAPRPIEEESELSVVYPLPVLARATLAGQDDDLRGPLAEAPQALREGFRALRAQIELRAADEPRADGGGSVVLLVSPGPSDGSASCSLNLARAFVSVQESVTLLELDLRNPRMAGMLGADPHYDIGMLVSGMSLERVAHRLDGVKGLRLVAAPPAIDVATLEQVVARSGEIVDASRGLSNWIVVDAPPISEAADALITAGSVDHIVVVVQLGSTSPGALGYLRELFEQTGRVPDGYLVVTGPAGGRARAARIGAPSSSLT
jgi:Mrp family chromosome partitioning ATPase/capsular polysaccharide biosynthesis protein